MRTEAEMLLHVFTKLIIQLKDSRIRDILQIGTFFLRNQKQNKRKERESRKSLANECRDTYHLVRTNQSKSYMFKEKKKKRSKA